MTFDWAAPNYDAVYEQRKAFLERIREPGFNLAALREFYREHPVEFVTEWGFTFDPRNPEIGLPATVPFVLFAKQEEFLDWLHDRWRSREDGLVEKSRDMGVSWLCVAFAAWMLIFHPGTVVGFGSRKEEYVDKIGDPKSLFWKLRQFIELLPAEFRPDGWDDRQLAPHMRVLNPAIGSSVIGEAGDNIGRGNRTSVYFKDEAAHFEHAEAIDAALSQTSNCKIDVSTPNGPGNAFYRKRHGGKIKVFVFDWRDDPRKDEAWYRKQCESLDPVIVAQEIDRNYEASVSDAFIPADLVLAAQRRGPADVPAIGGLRVGVDVARFGDDKSAVTVRRGRVLLRVETVAKQDVVQVAGWAKQIIDSYKERPEQIAVDTIGIGAGVADTLRGWYGKKVVVDVNASLRMVDGQSYNLRALMWREMREWLRTASIPQDQDLKVQLTSLRYSYKGGEVLMESKDDAKKRGVRSPDMADSLALTFAIPSVETQYAKIDTYVPLDVGMGM